MKLVTIRINVESEVETGLRFEANIFDCLFSDYTHLFDEQDILSKFKKAMSITKGKNRFIVTIDLLKNSNEQPVLSNRYVFEYSELKHSRATNGSNFYNWQKCEHKDIKLNIGSTVKTANELFIELLKK